MPAPSSEFSDHHVIAFPSEQEADTEYTREFDGHNRFVFGVDRVDERR